MRLLSITATVLLLASCAPEPTYQEIPAEIQDPQLLWDAVDERRSWTPISHDHNVDVYAQDPVAIDGQNLSTEAALGTLVACEQYDEDGELAFIEAFLRVEDELGVWYSARFDTEGDLQRHRIVDITCGDCHLGSRDANN